MNLRRAAGSGRLPPGHQGHRRYRDQGDHRLLRSSGGSGDWHPLLLQVYLKAWHARDFSTMRTVFPSGVPQRFQALGRYHDNQVVRVRPGDGSLVGTGFEGHRYSAVVDMRMTISGMNTADLTWPNGPGGRSFAVLRNSETEPWQVVDQGVS